MPKPTLAVAIPCYNRQEELAYALASLVLQTDPDFTVFVCDDGSTDDIQSVVSGFKDRLDVTCITIANSGGPARPRNVCIERSSADWISFLDSDDWWFPNRVAEVRKSLTDDFDVVFHRLQKHACDPTSGTARPLDCTVGHDLHGGDTLQSFIMHGNGVATSGVTVRRGALIDAGGFCEDRELSSVEDFDLWLRLASAGRRFRYLSDVLGAYRIGGEQISNFSTQYDRQGALFRRQLSMLPSAYRKMAEARFEYLLGSYAQRLGLPDWRAHFRKVGFGAGISTWLKARAKSFSLA